MSNPAQTYLAVHKAVDALIRKASEHDNDSTRVAYFVARAALLHIKGVKGVGKSAETAYQLADEFATDGSI